MKGEICGAIRRRTNGPAEVCTLPPDHSISGYDHHWEDYQKYHRSIMGYADLIGRTETVLISDKKIRETRRSTIKFPDPPDDRSDTPAPGMQIPDGVQGAIITGRGLMSAEELAAQVNVAIEHIRLWQAAERESLDLLNQASISTLALMGNRNVDAVMNAANALANAREKCEEGIQNAEAAIENLAGWSIAFGGLGGQ